MKLRSNTHGCEFNKYSRLFNTVVLFECLHISLIDAKKFK